MIGRRRKTAQTISHTRRAHVACRYFTGKALLVCDRSSHAGMNECVLRFSGIIGTTLPTRFYRLALLFTAA